MWQQLRSKQFSKKTIPWMFVFAAILAYGLLTPWMGFYWDDWVFVWLLKHHGPVELARSFLPFDPLVSPFFLISSSLFGTNAFATTVREMEGPGEIRIPSGAAAVIVGSRAGFDARILTLAPGVSARIEPAFTPPHDQGECDHRCVHQQHHDGAIVRVKASATHRPSF